MPLSKIDITQIRKVIREEVEAEVKDSARNLEGEIRSARMRVQSDISELDDRMKNVEIRTEAVGKDVADIKKRTRKIEKTVNVTAKLLDKDIVKTFKRVGRIEDHLGIPAQ